MGKRTRSQAPQKLDRALDIIVSEFNRLPDLGTRLLVVEHLRRCADDLERWAVLSARAEGLSWSSVGAELGVSKSSACERFGPSTK